MNPGYALKFRKPQNRKTENVVALLNEKYYDGMKTGKKWTANEVCQLMKSPHFTIEERQTEQQIKSYWSKLSRDYKKNITK